MVCEPHPTLVCFVEHRLLLTRIFEALEAVLDGQLLGVAVAKQYIEEIIAKGTTDPDGGRWKLAKNGQTLSANANPLDLFDQPLLLDMIFLGTPQLCGGVDILFFFKVSFEKHPTMHHNNDHMCTICLLYTSDAADE